MISSARNRSIELFSIRLFFIFVLARFIQLFVIVLFVDWLHLTCLFGWHEWLAQQLSEELCLLHHVVTALDLLEEIFEVLVFVVDHFRFDLQTNTIEVCVLLAIRYKHLEAPLLHLLVEFLHEVSGCHEHLK